MPTGQPDPRFRARPTASETLDDEAGDFLDLDQGYEDGPLAGAEHDLEAGAWDLDPADREEPLAAPGSYETGSYETGAWADEAPLEAGELAGRGAGHEDLGDLDFDLEDAEAASWLMEFDEDSLDGIGLDALSEYGEASELPSPFDAALPTARSRSPFLLAAVVVLSVSAGVVLARLGSHYMSPLPSAVLDQELARGPRPTPDRLPGGLQPPDPSAAQVQPDPGSEPSESLPPLPADPDPILAGAEPVLGSEPETVQPEPSPSAALVAVEPAPAEARPESGEPTRLAQLDPPSSSPRPSLTEPVAVAPGAPAGESSPGTGAAPPSPFSPLDPFEPEPLAPLRGPVREATAADLANVWAGNAIPLEALDRRQNLVTPHVGRVRVVTYNGEMYEGRLHAIGRGKIWLQSGQSRMALMGWQVSRIEHVLGTDDTPVPGQAGSEKLAGLPSVRVRTSGGVFYGKLVSQQGDRITLVTDEGARISLERGVIEPAGRSRTRVVEVAVDASDASAGTESDG